MARKLIIFIVLEMYSNFETLFSLPLDLRGVTIHHFYTQKQKRNKQEKLKIPLFVLLCDFLYNIFSPAVQNKQYIWQGGVQFLRIHLFNK